MTLRKLMVSLLLISMSVAKQMSVKTQGDSSQHPNSVYSQMHSKHGRKSADMKIFYQTGESDKDLPVCSPMAVCGKVDTYGAPWMEKQCRCPGTAQCSTSSHAHDGHTVHDRNKQYKVCEPVKKLKKCRYFRDVTWTNIMYPDNSSTQVMHCRCPKNSVAYLVKRQSYNTDTGMGYQFSFACSPQTKLKCQRKEPCRLFSVKKSGSHSGAEEVSLSQLCSCPHNHRCPKHHLDMGVVPGKVYSDQEVRTYSGYCV